MDTSFPESGGSIVCNTVGRDRFRLCSKRNGCSPRPARARVLVDVDLSDVQTYDVFPDGERFLVIARAAHADERQPIIQPGGHAP